MSQPAPIIPNLAKIARLGRLTNGQTPKVVVGDTTNADATLSSLAAMAGVAIGATVTGVAIPAATTVIAIDDVAHTAEMSANATADGTDISFTFTNPANPGPLKFRIGKVGRTIDDAVTVAELAAEEADADDYPAGGWLISYTPGYQTVDRVPSNESQLIQWIMASAVVTNTLYYWWIDDGVNVWMAANFENPLAMARVGAAFKAIVEDSYPPGLPLALILP